MLGVFGGNDIDVEINVLDAHHLLRPGAAVDVTITLKVHKASKIRSITAGLVHVARYQVIEQRTDSDGDEYDARTWRNDEQWITQEVLGDSGSLGAGTHTHHFRWIVPTDAAPSFAGDLVQHRWLVRADVDRKLAKDLSKQVEVRVGSGSAAPAVSPAALPHRSDTADVEIELKQHSFVEGQSVAGRLVVAPKQALDLRGIRIELVRQETVAVGNKPHVRDVPVQRIEPSGKVSLQTNTSVAYEFTLPVPPTAPPTYQSPIGRAEWIIKAVLDRPLKTDVCVQHAITVHN